MFKVEFIGNLGADAEVKEANGSKFITMRIALTDRYKNDKGEVIEKTTWADVTMSRADSPILPYLKQGVKLFVRGNGSLRVYSSPKDRMMKAGISCAATEIELVGGSSDAVPRRLIVPETGQIVDVKKFYWVDGLCKGMKAKDTKELIDQRANKFAMDFHGFVVPVSDQQPDAQVQGEEQSQS